MKTASTILETAKAANTGARQNTARACSASVSAATRILVTSDLGAGAFTSSLSAASIAE
jgi:hypothetical protein